MDYIGFISFNIENKFIKLIIQNKEIFATTINKILLEAFFEKFGLIHLYYNFDKIIERQEVLFNLLKEKDPSLKNEQFKTYCLTHDNLPPKPINQEITINDIS